MRLSLRVVLIALIAIVAVGAFVSAPGAKPGTTEARFTEGACTESGVTFVIEFGAARQRCATDFKGTSWQLFAATATKVTGTSQYPTGFVCKIEGQPVEQDCKDTPRYDEGTWAFFISNPGSKTWVYALTGAATHFSQCGSAEAWVFVPSNASPQTALPVTKPVTFKCD